MKVLSGRKVAVGVVGLFAITLLVSACSSAAAGDVAAKDQEIAALRAQVAKVEQDGKYWNQLTDMMKPVEMRSMTDHRAYMLPSGLVLAMHFDNMDLSQAENLNWLAVGFPGKFCREDQERLEKEFGPGVTHFHDLKADTHGGAPGTEGIWFIHAAVRSFEAPWGAVTQGVDGNFMPTPAPACGS